MANIKRGALGRALYPGWSKVFDNVMKENNMAHYDKQREEQAKMLQKWQSKREDQEDLSNIINCLFDINSELKIIRIEIEAIKESLGD